MVDVKKLMQKPAEIIMIPVKGRANKEHVDAVHAMGITADVLVEAAYKEAFEQIQRDASLKTLAPNGKISEKVPPPIVRGDVPVIPTTVPVTQRDKIVEYLRRHKEGAYTEEMADRLGIGQPSVSPLLWKLKEEGIVGKIEGDTKSSPCTWYLIENGNPQEEELKAIMPHKFSTMG